MDIVLCKKCIYWDLDNSDGYWESHHPCKSGKFIYSPKSSELDAMDSVFYQDSEDYKAYLCTGPDFGCIHGVSRD